MTENDFNLWKWEQNKTIAKEQHNAHRAQVDANLSHASNFGQFAIRTANVIAGGAVAISLAFAGTVYSESPTSAAQLVQSIVIFGIAALTSGFSTVAAYFSQLSFYNASVQAKYTWDYPYVESLPTSKRDQLFADGFRTAAVVLLVCSYIVLGVGLFAAHSTIANLLTPTLQATP